jgi:voltage-gated potassium channel
VNTTLRRLGIAAVVLTTLIASGTLGFYHLGQGRWSLGDCFFMTVITLSTVGFGELSNMSQVPGARMLTVALIAGGIGALAYVQSNLTALLVEGLIGKAWRKNRMRKLIEQISNHVVVAGAGSTGRHVVEELMQTDTKVVVVDQNQEQLERLNEEVCNGKLLYVLGDATSDQVLLAAGITRARGLVAALTHDKDNLFVTLSARGLNERARIVSKVTEDAAAQKMIRAGASAVVSPTLIGGRRMASELVRPDVVQFFDQMLRDNEHNLRLEEVRIGKGSKLAEIMLRDTPIRKETRALVVAVKDHEGKFHYNPEPDHRLHAGNILVVMADAENVAKLRALAG